MKTNVVLIAALMLIGVNVAAIANAEDPRNARVAIVPVKGSEVFKVIYKGETSSRVRLNLYNSASQLIFSEVISGDGFIRPLNFAGLQAGQYTIELIDGSFRRTEKVDYAPGKAVAATKKVIHVSRLSDENKFLISVTDAASEVITVKIFDLNNNLLFTESREVSGEFAQIYWVKNHRNVTIEVSDSRGNLKVSRY